MASNQPDGAGVTFAKPSLDDRVRVRWQCETCGFNWKPKRNWTRKDPVRCKACGSKVIKPCLPAQLIAAGVEGVTYRFAEGTNSAGQPARSPRVEG